MTVRITCVSKPSGWNANPHEAISRIGWISDSDGTSGISSRIEIYDFLKNNGKAYVRDSRGDTAYLYPRENLNGTKYVQTYADGVFNDNLLALSTCVGA